MNTVSARGKGEAKLAGRSRSRPTSCTDATTIAKDLYRALHLIDKPAGGPATDLGRAGPPLLLLLHTRHTPGRPF
jgi:hypothetical protein